MTLFWRIFNPIVNCLSYSVYWAKFLSVFQKKWVPTCILSLFPYKNCPLKLFISPSFFCFSEAFLNKNQRHKFFGLAFCRLTPFDWHSILSSYSAGTQMIDIKTCLKFSSSLESRGQKTKWNLGALEWLMLGKRLVEKNPFSVENPSSLKCLVLTPFENVLTLWPCTDYANTPKISLLITIKIMI